MERIKVVIVEDDDACLLVHYEALKTELDIEVIGYAKTSETAFKMIQAEKPDVVLLDINLTDKDDQEGIDIAIELSIAMPELKIIMLSGLLNEETVRSTIGLGVACNYLVKSKPEEIAVAIRSAVRGDSSLEGTVISFILKDYQNTVKLTMQKLTKHHLTALELFYRGYNVEAVAKVMSLQSQSVRNLQQEIAKRCFGWKWRLKNLSTMELAKRAKKMELF